MLVKMVKPVARRKEHTTSFARFKVGGEPVEVSEKEAMRLVKTFPGSFEVVKERQTAPVTNK